ncbi:hypothetical protein V1956_24055 [Yersinia sp. 2540 StPb PI]|uniref:hypothetical protein n=1 Tax=Yersinia sp. 2540 StPb PI TaxID=3117406 RepID=UPI003FA45C04
MDREININNIVILIGQDVIGKFTIIDAYENFDVLGKEKHSILVVFTMKTQFVKTGNITALHMKRVCGFDEYGLYREKHHKKKSLMQRKAFNTDSQAS